MLENVRTTKNVLANPDIPSHFIMADSVLTYTAYAAPAYFRDYNEGEPLNYSHYRGTKTHEVVFPSDKGVLISWWGGGGTPDFAVDDSYTYPLTFADGSTSSFSREELIAIPCADAPFAGSLPVHTTYQGLAGRDR